MFEKNIYLISICDLILKRKASQFCHLIKKTADLTVYNTNNEKY